MVPSVPFALASSEPTPNVVVTAAGLASAPPAPCRRFSWPSCACAFPVAIPRPPPPDDHDNIIELDLRTQARSVLSDVDAFGLRRQNDKNGAKLSKKEREEIGRSWDVSGDVTAALGRPSPVPARCGACQWVGRFAFRAAGRSQSQPIDSNIRTGEGSRIVHRR